jgi:RHS repeat-associated protein
LGIDEVLWRWLGLSHFPLPDRNGNTAFITGDIVNGAAPPIREQYRYDAFGAPTFKNAAGTDLTTQASAIGNRFLFTGREYNSLFGFYEYRARAYHPGLGRFMSEDPKGFDAGDYNFFRYCGNDPLDETDPMGLAPYIGFSPMDSDVVRVGNYYANRAANAVRARVTGFDLPWRKNGQQPTIHDYGSAKPGDPNDPNAPVGVTSEGYKGSETEKRYSLRVMTKNGLVKGQIASQESFGRAVTREGNVIIDPAIARTTQGRFVPSLDGRIHDLVKAGSLVKEGVTASGTTARAQYYKIWVETRSGGGVYNLPTRLNQVYKYQDGVPVEAHLEVGP